MIRTRLFSVVALGFLMAPVWVHAQQGDPFADPDPFGDCQEDPFADSSDDPFKGNQDPFDDSGAEPEADPFARSAAEQAADEQAEQRIVQQLEQEELIHRLQQARMELTHRLNQMEMAYQQERYEMEALRNQFEVRIFELEHELGQLRQRTAPAAPLHNNLTYALIASPDPAQQLMGLKYLVALDAAVTAEEFVPVELDQAGQDALTALVESPDPEIRRLAAKAASAYLPQAIFLGFQPANGYWEPVPNWPEPTTAIRNALAEKGKVDFVDVRLRDVLDELADIYRIQIIPDPAIDLEQPVTIKLSGDRFSMVLATLLKQNNLAYRVSHDHIAILPAEHPELAVSLTYNVRGLLVDGTTLEKLVGLLETRFADRGDVVNVSSLDEQRVVVIASENLQLQVSGFLGSLAGGR